MEPIRILLANPHPIIRNGLRSLLEREPAFHIIGEAATGRESVVLAEYRRPHVALLDFKFPDFTGIAAAREIFSKQPALAIIFVSALADQEYISEAFKAGARGYVLGDSVPADLASAVRVVAKGGWFLSPAISSQLIEAYAKKHSPADFVFSEQEKQLFCFLAAGCDEDNIAYHLKSNLQSNRGAVRLESEKAKQILQSFGMPDAIVNSVGGDSHSVRST